MIIKAIKTEDNYNSVTDKVSLELDDIRQIEQSNDGRHLFIGTKDRVYLVRDEGGSLWKELDAMMYIKAWCSARARGDVKSYRSLYLKGKIRYRDDPRIKHLEKNYENVEFCFYERPPALENSKWEHKLEHIYGKLDSHLTQKKYEASHW